MAFLSDLWHSLPLLIRIILGIIAIVGPLMGLVAYYTLAERKVIGFMQIRPGPNRVGPKGMLTPIADAVKLMFKEIVLPARADKVLFILAPIVMLTASLAVWAVIPFNDGLVLADINAAVLYVLALSSLGAYGVALAGWSANSRYALLSAMRGVAQMISYEISMGFALLGVMLAAGSLRLGDIVAAQQGGILHWYWLPLLPLFGVYLISGVAETNRAPFDVAEGESEIVAGFHVEYSGMGFAIFFLAEYANMVLISMLTALMFFGGWLSPLPQAWADIPLLGPGFHWLLLKALFFMFFYLWIRATFPRYRYDQIMRLGWKIFIPLTLVWVVIVAAAVVWRLPPWWGA